MSEENQYKPEGLVLTLGEDSPSSLTPPYNLTLTLDEGTPVESSYSFKVSYAANIRTPEGIVLNFKKDMPGHYSGDLDFDPFPDDFAPVEVVYRVRTTYTVLLDAEDLYRDVETTATFVLPRLQLTSELQSLNKPSEIQARHSLMSLRFKTLVGAVTELEPRGYSLPVLKTKALVGALTDIVTSPVGSIRLKYTAEAVYDPNMDDTTVAYSGELFERGNAISNTVFARSEKYFFTDLQLKEKTEIATHITTTNKPFFEKYNPLHVSRVDQVELQDLLWSTTDSRYERLNQYQESSLIGWESANLYRYYRVGNIDKLGLKFKDYAAPWEYQEILSRGILHLSQTVVPYAGAKDVWYESTTQPKKGASYRPTPPPPPEPMYIGVGEMCFCEDIIPLWSLTLYTNGVITEKKIKYFRADIPPMEFELDCSCEYNPRYYNVQNTISLKRVDTGQEIPVTAITISTDIDSWAWDFKATVPYQALAHLDYDGNGVLMVEASINGFKWKFLLEDIAESKRFSANSLSLYGRSPTALLSEPYAGVSSYAHTVGKDAIQLAMEEVAKIPEPVYFNWELVSPLSWHVPAGAWSYSGKTPIEAIKEIAQGVGGVIISDPEEIKLHVKSRYRVPYWRLHIPYEYEVDNVINAYQAYTSSIKRNNQPEYNGVFAHAQTVGVIVQATISGTDGAHMAPTVISPFVTTMDSGACYATNTLSATGRQKDVTYTTVLDDEVGMIQPTNLVRVRENETESWVGYAKSCSISASISSDKVVVMQDVTLEKHLYEPTTTA